MLILRSAVLVFTLLVFGRTGAAAVLTDLPWVPKELPRLIISTYPDSLKHAHYAWLKEESGLFRAFFSMRADFHSSDFCESLLEASQLFSLNKMIERRNYISPTQKAELLKVGDKLKSWQFRFFELIQTVDANDLEGRSIDPAKGDMPMTVLPFFNDKVALIEATVWTVAAQSTSSHVRRQIERMPWQLDQEFASVKFDRQEFPYAWEIGRAAHLSGADMSILLRGAALGILNELSAYGAEPKDGYVFTHALGPVQARLFKARKNTHTGQPLFRVFASSGEPGTNEVLFARVDDFLEAYAPGQFSQRLATIKNLSGGRLNDLAAMEHLYAVRDYQRQDLDVISPSVPDRRYPIVLENTTPTPGWFMAKVSQKYGVYDAGPAISKYLSSTGWVDQDRRDFRSVDSDIPGMMELAKHKAIGLSNFSDSSARSFSGYVKLILMAAYFHWERNLAREYPLEAGQLLDMTQFMVMSGHDSVVEQASAIPGVRIVPMSHQQVKAHMETGNGVGFTVQPNYKATTGPVFAFERHAILALIKANPALSREAQRALRKGNAQIQSMSLDANAF